jgi:hypothetical protein
LEETVLDFTLSSKLAEDPSVVTSEYGDSLSLLSGVFGANAAGKTNLLKAIAFVDFFAKHSFHALKPKDIIPLDRFGSDEGGDPASFTIEFEGKSGRYQYHLVLSPTCVFEENLKVYSGDTKQFRSLLSRKRGKEGQLQIRSFAGFTEVSLLRETLMDRPNASMLAAGLQTGRKEFEEVLEAMGRVITNVNREGKADQPFESLTSNLFSCSEFFQKHPEYHDGLRELLQAADLGITDFEFQPIRIQDEKGQIRETYLALFHHIGPHGKFQLSVERESSGTKRLFMLFETFVQILSEGGMAVIDEMESDLHPHLIPVILGLFSSPEINQNKAQLFFTCHHVEILNHLMKEQIFLVEKNDECVSEAYRLDEIKGVRREENFFANYNSGKYGAVPEPEVVAF